MSIASIDLTNFKGNNLSVDMFANGQFLGRSLRILDANITSGTATVTSASGKFTAEMVGWIAYIENAGVAGAGLVTTILSFTNTTTIVLAVNASTTVVNKESYFGLDSTTAFQAAVDYISTTRKNGGVIRVPKGMYLTTATINIPSHVRLEGECYVNTSIYGSSPVEPPSFIRCVNAVKVFSTSGAPCYSPSFSSLGISGVPYTGSKGIYGATVWNCTVENCFFENFGDQAIHLEKFDFSGTFSVTAAIRNNFAQNCCRIRTRAAFVGVFDLGPTDCFIYDNNVNASMDGIGIVNNFIAALAIRGPQSFIGPNQCGHSEIGVYVDSACSHAVFMNTRADNNQGRGFVIAGSSNGFIGCRSFANSQASDGTYNGFEISGGGNSFTACRVGWNGLGFGFLSYRLNNAFVTTNANTTEPNYGQFNNISDGSYLGVKYLKSGTQVFPTEEFSAFDPIGLVSHILRGIDLSIRDQSVYFVATAGAADQKVWRQRLNYVGATKQLVRSVLKDDYTTEAIYEIDNRGAGATVDYKQISVLLKAILGLQVTGDCEITSGKIIYQASTTSINVGSGSPETVVTAVGGSIYLDYGGSKLWLKTSGSGNTGWTEVVAGVSLPVIDTTALVKGSGDATKLFRVEADGITTATTRVGTVPDRDFTFNQLQQLSAFCSSLLTCTTSYADVTGASITLDKTGNYLIIASFNIFVDQPANGITGKLVVGGVSQTGVVQFIIGGVTVTDQYSTVISKQWIYNNSGSNIAKLQATKAINAGTGQVTQDTCISAIFLG